jgi:hypothetical protein
MIYMFLYIRDLIAIAVFNQVKPRHIDPYALIDAATQHAKQSEAIRWNLR